MGGRMWSNATTAHGHSRFGNGHSNTSIALRSNVSSVYRGEWIVSTRLRPNSSNVSEPNREKRKRNKMKNWNQIEFILIDRLCVYLYRFCFVFCLHSVSLCVFVWVFLPCSHHIWPFSRCIMPIRNCWKAWRVCSKCFMAFQSVWRRPASIYRQTTRLHCVRTSSPPLAPSSMTKI